VDKNKEGTQTAPATLGDVLYAKCEPPVSEQDWATLVESIAACDQLALHAPGIECKLLATDAERHRVSMLVRLAPGARYPAHTHAGVEELHLLDGQLWIDERKLFPGLQLRSARCWRRARLERDRLHLPSRYQYQRCASLTRHLVNTGRRRKYFLTLMSKVSPAAC
jgi:hypothetical protein